MVSCSVPTVNRCLSRLMPATASGQGSSRCQARASRSRSVTRFAVAEKTCGQAECHENTKVQLGKMSSLTLHCASCHDFNKPVGKTVKSDSLPGTMKPARSDCLSCHAMREKAGATIAADTTSENARDVCPEGKDRLSS